MRRVALLLAALATSVLAIAFASPVTSAARRCVVDGSMTGIAFVMGDVGVDSFPSCHYRATEPGGFEANGRWRIAIQRSDGTTHVVDSGPLLPNERFQQASQPTNVRSACAMPGLIRPGDEVHVTLYHGKENVHLTAPGRSGTLYFVRVGREFHC